MQLQHGGDVSKEDALSHSLNYVPGAVWRRTPWSPCITHGAGSA